MSGKRLAVLRAGALGSSAGADLTHAGQGLLKMERSNFERLQERIRSGG